MPSAKSEETVKVNKWLRPTAQQTATGVQNWYQGQPEFIGLSDLQRGYLGEMSDIAGQGAVTEPFLQRYQNIMDPEYLSGEAILSTPGLESIIERSVGAAGGRELQSAMAGNRLGGLTMSALADARANIAADLQLDEYRRRQAQQDMMSGMLPMAEAAQYSGLERQMGIEEQLQAEERAERDWPLTTAERANMALGTNPLAGATTVSQRQPFDWGALYASMAQTGLGLAGQAFGAMLPGGGGGPSPMSMARAQTGIPQGMFMGGGRMMNPFG